MASYAADAWPSNLELPRSETVRQRRNGRQYEGSLGTAMDRVPRAYPALKPLGLSPGNLQHRMRDAELVLARVGRPFALLTCNFTQAW